MITLDSGVLIAYLDPADGHHAHVADWLADRVIEEFAASVLTLAEALVHPAAAGHAERARRAVGLLGVAPVELAVGDEGTLAEIRASTRLRMPDAVVLHTAERVGGGLATTDRTVARAAADRGLDVHLLAADRQGTPRD